jgi:hypothetical protein
MPKISKPLKFLIALLSLVLFATYLTFFPFIHLNFAVNKFDSSRSKNTPVITKFDFFKPKITQLIPLSNGYYAVVSDFERDGVFFLKDTETNDGVKKPIDFGSVDARIENKTLEEAKKIVSQNNVSLVNPDTTNIVSGKSPTNQDELKLIEAKKPENSYFDRIKLEHKPVITDVRAFSVLRVGNNQESIKNIVGDAQISYPFASKELKKPELQYLINSDKINFVSLLFSDNLLDQSLDKSNPNSKLQRIVIVKQDRTFVEVPTKPDGTFDFDSVMDSLK